MNQLYTTLKNGCFFAVCSFSLLLSGTTAQAQSCPTNSTTSISSYPNTYYPGGQTTVNAGSKSIVLGKVTYGTTAISTGDIVLIIQMQGAWINTTNTSSYGDGATGSGYLVNSSLIAGQMEYAVAANSVPLTGGTLTLTTGTVNTYHVLGGGTNNEGQFTFQVIRVPIYYNLKLTGTITPPYWDGSEGGVVVLHATYDIQMNGQIVNASGRGFRGGGGRKLRGTNGSYFSTDYATSASVSSNGSKGEGIAGTPQYANDSDVTLVNSGVEGYYGGSYAQGAPGNAGGGGTDGDPSGNDQNTGGGGGGNGGMGGMGGWAWSSATVSGGQPGSAFAQVSASRLVMGGGGGAGTNNDGTGTPGNGFASSGAAGGGIIIIMAEHSISGSGTLLANGDNGNTTVQNDGSGGGGAGGSILIFSENGITSNLTVIANGGTGGANETSGGPMHGPGGGGGGGVIISNASLAAGSGAAGGAAGTTAGLSTNYGASAGSNGHVTTNATLAQLPTFPLYCTILGMHFVDFTAQADNNSAVNLQWMVSEEVNTTDYLVERSTDGTHFTVIATVAYKASHSADNTYSYSDEGASAAFATANTVYYRIRETEGDGNTIYSKVVPVEGNSSAFAGKFIAYPNPAQSFVTVSFSVAAAETVSLRLFDLKGSQLWMQQYEAQAGINALRVDMIQTLPEGVYILQWFDKLNSRQVKIMVHR